MHIVNHFVNGSGGLNMAHKFYGENEVKRIIEELYKLNHIAGMICELCFVRNFRVSDVRYAKAGHFKTENGNAQFYLKGDKMSRIA